MKRTKITVADKIFYIKTQKINNQIWFQWEGRIFVINSKESFKTQKKSQEDKERILSPMPGKIIKILVEKGQKIRENQALLILSSMKMEYTLKSPGKGVIKSVKTRIGDQVAADQELIYITSPD